jgi:LmbE family N-acetylglucosaminyl deacetylase
MNVATVLSAMRALPVLPFEDLPGTAAIDPSRLLILAPHPDDESLGCGGLIAECAGRLQPPFIIFITDGTGSHPASTLFPPPRLRALREAEARVAIGRLGLDPARALFLRLPDTAAPSDGAEFAAAVAAIGCAALAWRSTAIAAPWRHDPHCDHLATHRMALAAAQALGLPHFAYPVWGWTLPPDAPLDTPVSGFRLDIACHLPAKRRAIAAHASQHGHVIRDDPGGFTLPGEFLSVFDAPHEVYLTCP